MANELTISKELVEVINPAQAWHYYVVPKSRDNGTMVFYAKSDDSFAREELEMLLGCVVQFDVRNEPEVHKALVRFYPIQQQKQSGSLESFSQNFDDFLPKVIQEAKIHNSSDIHVEAFENVCRIRFRIDGKLVERYQFGKDKYPALINKIKIQAHLDIAEKRLPQDGRIFFRNGNDKIDIRVSVLPTLYGEKVVLRLLNKDTANIALDALGFSVEQLEVYLKGIQRPNGIILISGPTGSGKTTTLYASLRHLNTENVNIMTVEDPVEYTIDGINQVHVKEDIGLTFAAALRTFLRQDPDIIMLGEIRDQETAQMAIRAALTGHLVFSTIHTNSALGTISRLLDMDVPSYLVANTLNLSMAQRLVRLLCPHCKKEVVIEDGLLPEELNGKINTHFVAEGCDHCLYTGYLGRKAIYEILPVDTDLAQNIKQNNLETADDLKIATLKDAAVKLYLQGLTSLDEIYSYLL
ncbi:type II/IV secretion system protein [Puteibacter caeruleilacunae]|nr:type II/IV secretion system protein [Puteibacter caeruleilacunae]